MRYWAFNWNKLVSVVSLLVKSIRFPGSPRIHESAYSWFFRDPVSCFDFSDNITQ